MQRTLKGGFLEGVILNDQPKRKWIRCLDFLQNMIPKKIKIQMVFHQLLLICRIQDLSTTLQKKFNILYLDAGVRMIFTLSPFFAHRRARGFRWLLRNVQHIIKIRGFLSRGIPKERYSEGMRWILYRTPIKMCDVSIIASRFCLNWQVNMVYCVLFKHLCIGLLLGDSLCEIIICFFRMYSFNVVHVFYVMSNSPNCNIFYLILKSIRSYCKKLKI